MHGLINNEKKHEQKYGLIRLTLFGFFGLFFQLEQCFSLTTIQPEQCFLASFSQDSASERSQYVNRNNKANGNKQLLTLINRKKSIRKNSTNSGAQ